MKLIYSSLQKFLPDLNVEPQKLRDDMNMIGHFTNFFEEINGEIVFDLDIKVNRGDCLGYYGLARDLSVLYNIPLNLAQNFSFPVSNYSLPIKVDTANVARVMAVKIVHLKNSLSPLWLQTFLKCHNLNSINTLVDLTNYIMFLYGIPSHAFDTAKSTDNLIWQMNPGYKEFTSLDGTVLKLDQNVLMINNPSKPLSLSFWGGSACAINESTTDTIIELAVYNPTIVRQNSRQLKTVTEAAIRLEKELDSELIPIAFNHLIKLILDNCPGQIGSLVFDYYPLKYISPQIEFNPHLPSTISGIDIPVDTSLDILQRLGCVIDETTFNVTLPSIRKDINIEQDLVEEILRFYGYQNIPTNQPLAYKKFPDITPPEIYLIEELKDKLVALGYDEVLSWPLVSKALNPNTVITTQNSINSESIYLRQSLIQSLESQLDQYQRFKLPHPQFFEIGIIFSKQGENYLEQNSLALYNPNLDQLRRDAWQCIPTDNWNIEGNFAEIILDNLPKPKSYIPQLTSNSAIELTGQIITLDANVTIDNPRNPQELIKEYSTLIDSKILWSMEIIDIYQNRYTFRVSYYNCDDKTAKKIHLTAFGLN